MDTCQDLQCAAYGKRLVDRGWGIPVCPTTPEKINDRKPFPYKWNKKTFKYVKKVKVWFIQDEEDNGRGFGSEQPQWFQDTPPKPEDPVSVLWKGEVDEELYKILDKADFGEALIYLLNKSED